MSGSLIHTSKQTIAVIIDENNNLMQHATVQICGLPEPPYHLNCRSITSGSRVGWNRARKTLQGDDLGSRKALSCLWLNRPNTEPILLTERAIDADTKRYQAVTILITNHPKIGHLGSTGAEEWNRLLVEHESNGLVQGKINHC
ncbi:MAG: hypothetical protein OXC02_09570 [Rhodobacteraceae bacterium]|nr:hypothetical protein [Paracoccaceae bacterium]